MKRLFILFSFVVFSLAARSQAITDTGALRTYINANIVTNGTKAITGAMLNRTLNGQLNVLPGLLAKKIDSVSISGSVMGFWRNGSIAFTQTLPGGGGGSETDPLSVHKTDSAAMLASYLRKADTTGKWQLRENQRLSTSNDVSFKTIVSTAPGGVPSPTGTTGNNAFQYSNFQAHSQYNDWAINGKYPSYSFWVDGADAGTLFFRPTQEGANYGLYFLNIQGRYNRVMFSGDNISSFTNNSGYLTATTADARYPLLSGSYVNPAWITSLPYSKITGTPTQYWSAVSGGIEYTGGSVAITTTTAAFTPPRLSTTQMNVLVPTVGSIIYNTTEQQMYEYSDDAVDGGPGWITLIRGAIVTGSDTNKYIQTKVGTTTYYVRALTSLP